MSRSELEEKIRDYCIDEGILGKSLTPDDKLEFGYEVNFPPSHPKPMKLLLLKIKDRKPITIQLATQIAPQHIEGLKQLSPNGAEIFFNTFKKIMQSQNLLYAIDEGQQRFIISDKIYPDGLSQDHFYLILRKIFNVSILVNTVLREILEGKVSDIKTGTKTLDDSNYSMFT